MGRDLPRAAEKFGAVHPGHALIGNDQPHIGEGRQQLQGRFPGRGGLHLEFFVHQQPLQRAEDILLVIHQQHGYGRCFSAH